MREERNLMQTFTTCLVIALLIVEPGLAQESQTIETGRLISGTLASDSRHLYAIDLEEGTFVFGEANQIGVDVVVKILGLYEEEIGEFDTSARGPESFQFETEEDGEFLIEVTPFREGEGNYSILVKRTEPIAADRSDRVDQLMSAYTGETKPGAVVGVLERGEMIFTRAYGMANLDHGIPFEIGTISNIGSVTKQFTAMGILLFQAEGKLSLEDDIRRHIPELPDFGTPVTIQNLLNHTGGYREIYNLLPFNGYRIENKFDREFAIRIVQRQPELQAEPNTEFNYNNTGFILLATVIERLSGQTFPEFMKERVFEPLGMSNTLVKAYQGEIIAGSAQGYVSSVNGFRTARDLAGSYGASGIYTTAHDMSRWMLNYRDATVGGPDAIAAMATSAVLAGGDTTHYGLGLEVQNVRGRMRYSHTGGDIAHRTYFAYFPELESGVILMSNNSTANMSLGWRIALLFFEDLFEPEEDVSRGDVTLSARRMEAIAGEWIVEDPGMSLAIDYSIEDGEMYAQLAGQLRFRVIPTSDSTFNFDGISAAVTFHFDSAGFVDSATHHQDGDMPMRRVGRVELAAEDLEEYADRYFCEELEIFYDVIVEDGELMVHNLRLAPMTLTHTEGDTFTGNTYFLRTVEFRRAENGQITGFMASNGRTRNVWFHR